MRKPANRPLPNGGVRGSGPQGGTQDIWFVKDGARVTAIELRPGAKLPRHHQAGWSAPAGGVSGLQVRGDVAGQGPMPGHFKSADVQWLPADLRPP